MTREEAKIFVERLSHKEPWTVEEVLECYDSYPLEVAVDERLRTLDYFDGVFKKMFSEAIEED